LARQPTCPAVIVDKLVSQAVEKAKTIDGGKSIGRVSMQRSAVALGLIAGIGAMLLVIGPEFLRQGASALLVLSKSAEAASPYAITVQPGDKEIPKGSDQTIVARLAGFRSNDVGVWVKADNEQKFSRLPLVATAENDKFEGMLFDVKANMTYYVEADGVKSPTYTMSVVELPAVTAIEMEYVYPAYTGLAPQKVEVGGDVAAIAGTEVRLKVTSSMATPGGRLQMDPAAVAGLTVQADGTLTGSFKVAKDGYYHVELDGPRGEKVAASPKYTIDVIEDRAPTVSFDKPKRDTNANPVEEVFVQARAQDDYGVRQLDLIYSVNGGPEKTVTLFGKGAKALDEVSAGHTIYMEELGVKAGDFVSYYAKAYDTDTVNGPKVTSSDIYFIQIRPFRPEFPRSAIPGWRWRRRWWWRAAESARRAVGAAAPDYFRHVQRRARSAQDQGGQVQGRHGVRAARAVEDSRGSAEPAAADEAAHRRSGWREHPAHHRRAAEGGPGDDGGRRAIEGAETEGSARARTARAQAPAGCRAGV
jgi:hypothetical protein